MKRIKNAIISTGVKENKMIITVMRHGETKYNFTQRIQGRIDIPLNKTGIRQAKEKGHEFVEQNVKFDLIFSSPLKRALKTAQIIAKKIKYPDNIYESDSFLERDFGFLDGKTYRDAKIYYQNENYAHESFESDESLINRVVNGVQQLAKVFPGKSILIVAHSHVIKALLVHVNPDKYDFKKGFIGHTEAKLFKIAEGKITIIE